MRAFLATALASLLIVNPACADETEAEAGKKPENTGVPAATAFITRHSGQFNGEKVEYVATAGETYLEDKDGKPKAAVFTFAYTKTNLDKDEIRPVTFVWNGGPGSASLWLHMGTFGPKRISVPSEEHEGIEFWGLYEDANSISEFIRDWVTANGRWNSPKFLLGESFGTTRAAAVANILEVEMMMSLNGIIFISQALDYAGSSPYVADNLTSFVTYLPTMAAAAHYHGKVHPAPDNLEEFVQEARDFAVDELLPALFKGNTLDPLARAELRNRLAYFTGLQPDYIERADLRINGFRFAKELLRDQGLAIGLLDARYTRDDVDDLTANAESDAASDAISPAFKAALMDHMRTNLGVDWDRVYLAPADDELSQNWRWRTVPDGEAWEPMPVNTARDLSKVLRLNPSLKVLVASGYYDLVTPFFDAEYTLNRHSITADRIAYRYYGGGHMMYVNEPSRTALLQDVREFVTAQSK
jgi:carboxypeptidase C (cathepsin A)